MKAMKQMGRHIHRRNFHDGSRHIALGMVHILVLRFLLILPILSTSLTVLLQGDVHLLTMVMVMDVHGHQRKDDGQTEHEYGQSSLHIIIYMSH